MKERSGVSTRTFRSERLTEQLDRALPSDGGRLSGGGHSPGPPKSAQQSVPLPIPQHSTLQNTGTGKAVTLTLHSERIALPS